MTQINLFTKQKQTHRLETYKTSLQFPKEKGNEGGVNSGVWD